MKIIKEIHHTNEKTKHIMRKLHKLLPENQQQQQEAMAI